MVLRIDRTADGDAAVMTLSGHLASEEVEELRRLVAAESAFLLILDLGDVVQVDRDAVTVLASCIATGVRLRNCPAHIVALMNSPENFE